MRTSEKASFGPVVQTGDDGRLGAGRPWFESRSAHPSAGGRDDTKHAADQTTMDDTHGTAIEFKFDASDGDDEPPPEVPEGYADVVVGGQAGSEGKGAIVAHLIRSGDYGAAVRPGSSNAGHTVYGDNHRGDAMAHERDGRWDEYVHQVIPSAATVSRDVVCYMAAESSFGLDEFFEEYQDMVDRWGADNAIARVRVDPKAAIITDEHRHTERDRKLGEDIGSTVHGCGAVRVEKIWRSAGDVRLAEDYEALRRRLVGSAAGSLEVNSEADRVSEALEAHGRGGEAVMIEGTQGTLLSMNHSPHWPFSTSRDCVASSFLSSCGLPPTAARDVWAVFRTYPIRVGGHSGPLDGEEIDFETIADRAGFTDPPVEFTSVTKKKRRIFEWSDEQFDRALRLNDPDLLAVTFLDYLDADNYGARTWWDLTRETRGWVRDLDQRARDINGSRVAVLKTGPDPVYTIDLRTAAGEGDDRRWSMGALPPVRGDGMDSPDHLVGDAEFAGPDDDWFDRHPTPEVDLSHDPGQPDNAEAAGDD